MVHATIYIVYMLVICCHMYIFPYTWNSGIQIDGLTDRQHPYDIQRGKHKIIVAKIKM